MPKITVTADPVSSAPGDAPVLLSESVQSVHVSTEHAAAQLIERLAWAIRDAEDAEGADGWDFTLIKRPTTKPLPQPQEARRGASARSRSREVAQV